MHAKSRKRNSWSGIAPRQLLAQVENTVPFLLHEGRELKAQGQVLPPERRYLEVLLAAEARTDDEFDHVGYFELCLAAHFATVGSFVPTDVDNQIRQKIWQTAPDHATIQRLVDLVEEFPRWDIFPVAARFVRAPSDAALISGLEGEWLGELAAAYAALLPIDSDRAHHMQTLIEMVLSREARVLEENLAARANLEVLKGATLIAHNLGDLDRVIDLWGLGQQDPLRTAVYKVGHQANARFGGRFLFPGELNKRHMAAENHRHFPLREPRILRERREYLLPLGPFFDDWGASLGRDSRLSERELSEVLSALIRGFTRVPGAVGYGRALAGLAEGFFGGARGLKKFLSAKLVKEWEAAPLYKICSEPRAEFEARWWRYPWELYKAKYWQPTGP